MPDDAGCAHDGPTAADRVRRLAVVFVALLAVIVGARTFLPDLLRPDLYKDDACQHIWWTYRFADPALLPNDPIAMFYSDWSHAPCGWQLLYKLLVPLVDAQVLSETIPLVLTVPTVVLIFLAGRRAYRPDGTPDAGAVLQAGVTAVTWMLVRDDLGFVKGGFPRSFALPILLLGLWALMAQRGALRNWPVLVTLAVSVLCVEAARTAYAIHKDLCAPPPADREAMLAFLTTLPKDTLVAAHPMDADDIPLRSRRSVLASKETSEPYYRGYYTRIAERIAAELAACYASDWKDVDALRDRYGVSVFVANAPRYQHLWPYFEPFTAAAQKQIERGRRDGFVLQNPPADRVLFRSGDYTVVRVGPTR